MIQLLYSLSTLQAFPTSNDIVHLDSPRSPPMSHQPTPHLSTLRVPSHPSALFMDTCHTPVVRNMLSSRDRFTGNRDHMSTGKLPASNRRTFLQNLPRHNLPVRLDLVCCHCMDLISQRIGKEQIWTGRQQYAKPPVNLFLFFHALDRDDLTGQPTASPATR